MAAVTSTAMGQNPWEITPALTAERLQLLASTIAEVRADAREGHVPEKGDDAWTFGCRAYRRTCHAFAGLALSGDHPWLAVDTQGLAFTLLVDGEPIKFYKGDAENPSSRSLRRGLDEALKQGKLSFYDDELASGGGWFWLLAVETLEDGSLLRAAVLQANENEETRNLFFIPTDPPIAVASAVVAFGREGIDLPPPVVAPKAGFGKASGDEDDGASKA